MRSKGNEAARAVITVLADKCLRLPGCDGPALNVNGACELALDHDLHWSCSGCFPALVLRLHHLVAPEASPTRTQDAEPMQPGCPGARCFCLVSGAAGRCYTPPADWAITCSGALRAQQVATPMQAATSPVLALYASRLGWRPPIWSVQAGPLLPLVLRWN